MSCNNTVVTPQLLEQWILQSNDPSNPQLQQTCTRYLQEWTTASSTAHDAATANGGTAAELVSSTLFQLLVQTSHPFVQFYVLTELQKRLLRTVIAPPQQNQHQLVVRGGGQQRRRQQLRDFIIHSLLFRTLSSSNNNNNGDLIILPNYLRNKIASVLAHFLIREAAEERSGGGNNKSGPDQWLLELKHAHPHVFLQTVKIVLEEFHAVSLMSSSLANLDDSEHPAQQQQQQQQQAEGSFHMTPDHLRPLKDVLKGYHLDSNNSSTGNGQSSSSPPTLLEQIFVSVVQILESSIAVSGNNNNSIDDSSRREELQVLALQTITKLFQWTEAPFLGSQSVVSRCLELMLYLIPKQTSALEAWQEYLTSCSTTTTTTTTTTAVPNLSSSSSITSLDDPKLPMIAKVLERIHSTDMLPYGESSTDDVDGETMETIIQMAAVINTAGLELLPLYQETVLEKQDLPNASTLDAKAVAMQTLYGQVLDLFFRAFAYDDIDVTTAVLPLASRLTNYMVEQEEATNGNQQDDRPASSATNGCKSHMRQYIPLFLNTLYNQMKYPEDFGYNDLEDEDEAEEQVFRTELCKVYNKLVRVAPSTCLQFLWEAVSAQIVNPATAATTTTRDVEATLSLLYRYCEGIRPPPGLKIAMKNDTFCALLVILHKSNILTQYPHREVLCLYYETAVRYYPIFLQQSTSSSDEQVLLSNVLAAMSGPLGLQHEHPRVRSRCCYLMLRLVKSTISLLRPFVETAVSGIQGLLSNHSQLLRSDDTFYLFEAIGLLLGRTGLDPTDQQRYLRAVMTPHAQSIQQILKTSMPNNISQRQQQEAQQHYGLLLSDSIAAITHLSKGFSKPADEVKVVLAETLNITLVVLEALPASEPVRNKSMVLLQRMIQCVGRNVLPFVPKYIHCLLGHCTSDDILFVSQIFNQVCIKFKEDAVMALDAYLLPFLQKCRSFVPSQESDSSDVPRHLQTEQLSVQKLAFAVLQHIVSNKATAILISKTNAGSFETVLQTMHDGAILVQDPVVKKTCTRFFRELVDQWADRGDDAFARAFLAFACQSVVPDLFRSMSSPSFKDRDANHARVVSEFSHLLFNAKTKSESLYIQLLTSMQATGLCPSDALGALRSATKVSDVEEILNQIFRSIKRS